MDAFESLVAACLWREGYRVQTSVWVDLTPEDRVAIERPTTKRWQVDLVAYKPGELLAVECKSYLDSHGVRFASFDNSHSNHAKYSKNFKLFNDATLHSVVLKRLRQQLAARGACEKRVAVTLALAYGRTLNESNRERIAAHFRARHWRLFDEAWLRRSIASLGDVSYMNDAVALTAKLLLRTSVGSADAPSKPRTRLRENPERVA